MAPQSAVVPTAAERDPIADARALVAMAVNLGSRARNAHRLGQVTDRKASLYVNTLVRHAARLLQTTDTHDVPVLHASARGPGGNALHFVIRHDQLDGPPVGQRFVTVGSDARLRCCVVSAADGSRIWADYDVSSAPEDLTLRVVLDALSELINRLEQAVTRLEAKQLAREAQLEADISIARVRLSGMTAEGHGIKRYATSEEPVRPWTRHVPGGQPARAAAAAAAPAAVAAVAPHTIEQKSAPQPEPATEAAKDTQPSSPVESDVFGGITIKSPRATPPVADDATASEAQPRRSFKLTRLGNAI